MDFIARWCRDPADGVPDGRTAVRRFLRDVVAGMIFGCTALLPPGQAWATCKVETTELPVTMIGLAPVVNTKINGADAPMIVDSGAFFSMLTPTAVTQYKLRPQPAPGNFKLIGVGGEVVPKVTTVEAFTLAGAVLKRFEFLVAGNEWGNGIAGLLGQNILRAADVAYDLPNGMIRLVRPVADCQVQDLAVWATGRVHSDIKIDYTDAAEPHTIGTAFLNGKKLRVLFDTGAATSVLSLEMARDLGLKPGGQDIVPSGRTTGIGRDAVDEWIAPFASFKIGDEEIKNTRIRVADVRSANWDMLLGADFFLSHRIYVSNSQRKLYFSYIGGPVFSLTTASSDAARGGSTPAEAGDGGIEPGTADAFSRRGMAFLARDDLERAIADLSRACALDPDSSVYRYQRGTAHLRHGEHDLGLADLDEALRLQPDLIDARMARADARLVMRDHAGARADLDEAARLATPEANLHLPLGRAYAHAQAFDTAVAQFDLWIRAHGKDVNLPGALADRCGASALGGFGLDQALSDCDAALAGGEASDAIHSSRGTVHLRRGEYQQAIQDFDAALAMTPEGAWPLLGRGLARWYLGGKEGGQADLAAAEAAQPGITEYARSVGIRSPDAPATP